MGEGAGREVIIAAIPRTSGQLVISIENHPKDGSSMVVLAHVAPDEKVTCRSPLQPSELKQVLAALTLAAQTLTARRPQHRTISASESLAEEKELF